MPIQMVCDSTPLVSAAIRDSLSATTAGNGRSAATGATASSSSSSSAAGFSALNHNGVNGNSSGSGGPSGTPTTSLSSSSLAAGAVSALNGGGAGGKLFRRAMLESSNHGNDDELLEDADGANDLVETISQSLRQGQQVKPITYEEGPSYSASLDKLKSKYIVLKATAPQSDEAGGGEAGAAAASSGGCPPNGASTGQQMHHPSPKLSLSTTSVAAAGGMMGKIPTAVTGATMNGGGGGGALKYGSSGTPHKSAPTGRPTNHNGVGTGTTGSSVTGKDAASLPAPKRTLFPRENVQVGWKTTGRKWQVGAGMINMGNTCYLNSTLQALFHVPAIANWLVSDVQHRARCDDGGSGGSCIICAMAKTLLDSQSNQSAIKPHLVYSKLRLVCKHLVPGRQEDAHEFLRYLVEAMEKSFLGRYKNSKELDQYSKETTPLNQILGGYLRSEVKCLSCHHISTTFQHFEDLLLDIRRANSIDEALKLYFDRERLEELSYNCEACKKRVAATKQFSLERAPFVLCVQLKRFTINGTKINKHVELRSQLDLTPYSSSSSQQQQHQRSGGGSSSSGMLTYRLTSMVTHLGTSQHCGHYTAIGQTEGGAYHVFDDSSVRPVGMHNVMSTNAYILFYELDSPAGAAVGLLNGSTKANQVAGHPSSTVTLSSMGALANGSVPLTSAMSSSAGNGASGASGGGAGSTGTPRKGTHNSTPSPLRVLGSGNSGTGSAGGSIFPSKLDTKPGFIGPVLPASISSSNSSNNNNPSNQAGTSPATTVTAATSSSTKTGTAGTTIGPTGISRPGSSASSSTSSLSPPSATGTPSSSPIKSVTNSPLSHPNKIHLKMSQTATQSPSAGGQALNTAKLNGIGSKQSPQVAAATATQLPSLPKLSLGPINNGSSRPGNSKPVTAVNGGVGSNSISLVPYETDDESDNANNSSSEEEEQQQQQTIKRAKQQQNGKLVLKRRSSDEDDDDEDDDDDDGDRHSHSPQIIKTTAGAWKVSKSSENDKPTYPESSSSSSSNAGSSKESSPVASPAQQQQHMHAPNGGSSASNGGNKNGHRNGVKSRSSSPPNAAAAAAGSSGGNGGTSSDTGPAAVQLLLKYSHRGYGAPVKSWGGQQTEMDRELANERREERKRQLADDRETEMDRGRTKKVKNLGGAGTNGSHQHQHGNQFQHFQNYQNGGGMKWNGGGNGNRNGNQQQYGNHHHNYHRGGGGGGGGYYHHRQGFRNNGGAGGGGRRFGGRNGGGFHAKAHHHHHHHHYRSEASSGAGGMASSSSSSGGGGGSGNSNGFYHR